MAKTSLLIDQGNTRIKWVWARNGELEKESAGSGGFDAFQADCRSHGRLVPDAVLLSSVAGMEKTKPIAGFCASEWGVEPQLLESTRERGGVKNGYDLPGMLGVDRWLAIVGAVSRHGAPVVIWDHGTATTLDAVDENGQHLGGLILPGPETMLVSLRKNTKLRIPEILEIAFGAGASEPGPGVPPARATSGCISHGVLAAQLGALNQFLRNVTVQMSRQPVLVITGGAASPILPLLDFDYIHDPWLVFRGMLVGP